MDSQALAPSLGIDVALPSAESTPLPRWTAPRRATTLGKLELQATGTSVEIRSYREWREHERVAVIDIGARGFRFIVVNPNTYVRTFVEHPACRDAVLCDANEALLLSDCAEYDSSLSAKGIARLVRTAQRVLQKHSSFVPDPAEVIVTGTSLFRHCPNLHTIKSTLETETGLRLNVLSGVAEGTIGLVGMVRSLAKEIPADQPIVTLDIGGGSTEVCMARVEDNRVVLQRQASLPLGTRVALHALNASRTKHEDGHAFLQSYVARWFNREVLGKCSEPPVVLCIGGGLVRVAGRQRSSHGKRLSRGLLASLASAEMTNEKPSAKYVTRFMNSDTQWQGDKSEREVSEHVAALIVGQVLDHYGATEAIFGGLGLRHSLAYLLSLGIDPMTLGANYEANLSQPLTRYFCSTRNTMPNVGDVAPDFELPSNVLNDDGKPGKKIKLSSFAGKPVLLAFYPLDFSPVCSGEVSCFRDDISQFSDLGVEVLGISVDSHWSHLAFAKQMGISFPLLADFEPKGAVCKQFGLYEEGRGFASRATVIVDKNGKIAYVKNHGLGTPRHNSELLEVLKTLS